VGNKYNYNIFNFFGKKGQGRYFCSELVAAAYQRMGILSEKVDPASVWPSSFGGNKLKLENGATFGEEMIIDVIL